MYHIAHNGIEDAILGSSNFTVRGLGLSDTSNNIELNLEVDSNRDRRDLCVWFDQLWSNEALVQDVKGEVLHYLEQLTSITLQNLFISRRCFICSRIFSPRRHPKTQDFAADQRR